VDESSRGLLESAILSIAQRGSGKSWKMSAIGNFPNFIKKFCGTTQMEILVFSTQWSEKMTAKNYYWTWNRCKWIHIFLITKDKKSITEKPQGSLENADLLPSCVNSRSPCNKFAALEETFTEQLGPMWHAAWVGNRHQYRPIRVQ